MKSNRSWILVLSLYLLVNQVSAAFSQAVPNPPYHQKLLRLSELLGSVHFLRTLCGEEGSTWRQSMDDILLSENAAPERKSQLVASFNHGYRSFDGVYLRCTPSAINALTRFMDEGAQLSDEIATRYGN